MKLPTTFRDTVQFLTDLEDMGVDYDTGNGLLTLPGPNGTTIKVTPGEVVEASLDKSTKNYIFTPIVPEITALKAQVKALQLELSAYKQSEEVDFEKVLEEFLDWTKKLYK